jgi:hypothetical protein
MGEIMGWRRLWVAQKYHFLRNGSASSRIDDLHSVQLVEGD